MDALIKQSMLDKNVKRTEVLRAIKNEFLVYQTAKGAKPLDDAAEFTILRKMVKQRLDSRDQYISAGRKDLADNESKEILVLESFLPSEASLEEIDGCNRSSQRREELVPRCSKRNTIKTYLV